MSIKMKRIGEDSVIEFIAFNYDGEGSSLAIENGFLDVYSKKDTNEVFEGIRGTDRKYEFIQD